MSMPKGARFKSIRPAFLPEVDPSTLSNYTKFSVPRTSLDLVVDWTKQIIKGAVTFHISSSERSISEIVLDSSHVEVIGAALNGDTIPVSLASEAHPALGTAVTVAVGSKFKGDGAENLLEISFSTTDKCTALQWLAPEQTAGKKLPYLFSQCQAIHCRSLFPCFDTPALKSKYNIRVRSEVPILCGALPVESDEKDVYVFEQNVPIPSYLFAIAGGNIVSADIGPRSKVYTEPENLKGAQWELEADTEKFIQVAENIIYPYEWKTYSVLVLPPSFPYGGMENPYVTFATPTIISGDRQNVDVIAHELAHAWSGNLVSNVSIEHFWLNEGWTVYLERRFLEALRGPAYRSFSGIIGWTELKKQIDIFNKAGTPQYNRLLLDLKDGTDPDDCYSTVSYEKGSTFILYLETVLGGKAAFDPFIPYYFSKFKFKSLDSFQFVDTLYEFFTEKHDILDSIDWDDWFFGEGMPPKPDFDTSVADACSALVTRWIQAMSPAKTAQDYVAEFSRQDLASWTSSQAGVFLDGIADELEAGKYPQSTMGPLVQAIGQVYEFQGSSNAEVINRWYRLAVLGQQEEQYAKMAAWVGTVGRMKFVRPCYRLLNAVDRPLALATFEKNRSFYHPICRSMVEKDLA